MNKRLLKSFMAKFGDTGSTLAKALGISETRFSAKINEKNGAEFTKSEIGEMIERYQLNESDIRNIFFNSEVS
jgi:hypothetical protein